MATTQQKHTITAFYETRDHADAAATKLRAAGVPASDVTVSPETARDEYGQYGQSGQYGQDTAGTATSRKSGFWASLEDMFGGTDDHHTYAEGVRRGHVLLTAHVADAQLDRAVAIVEEHGSIDLDEHEESWRSEGWTGAPATTSNATTTTATTGAMGSSTASTLATAGGAMGMALAGKTAPTRVVETETVVERTSAVAPAAKAPAPVAPKPVPKPVPSTGTAGRGAKDVVQIVEERLDVGKRAVSRGKVRLHSYVVEREVSEDVTLRDETVSIDRHAVDRPVAELGADAFKERTIELEEFDEEAVVAKTARVVEEIGIRKDVSDRVETVRDTVRSTKVDIEDGRTVAGAAVGAAAGTAAGAKANFTSRLVKDLEVVGSDGVHVGVIDRLDGTMMKLKRMDATAGGQHHLLPVDLVGSVEGKAMLSVSAAEAMRRWTAA